MSGKQTIIGVGYKVVHLNQRPSFDSGICLTRPLAIYVSVTLGIQDLSAVNLRLTLVGMSRNCQRNTSHELS